MNLEIASLWTAALRSGKYEQTTQKLCTGEGFCCLGVLSELYLATPGANLARHDITNLRGDLLYAQYIFDDEDGNRITKDSALPRPAREWAGLEGDLGDLCDTVFYAGAIDWEQVTSDESESLADLNDSGLTFAQIADVIDYVAADL